MSFDQMTFNGSNRLILSDTDDCARVELIKRQY